MLAYEILSDFILSPFTRDLHIFFNYICYLSEKIMIKGEKRNGKGIKELVF